jgi:hypothetical protein
MYLQLDCGEEGVQRRELGTIVLDADDFHQRIA